jgi:hypothetical protein
MKWPWFILGIFGGLALAVIHKHLTAEWLPAAGTISLETLDHIFQIGLFFVAAGALLYARNQVNAARDDIEQQSNLAQATFLFNLDRRWESSEMWNGRKLFRDLNEKLKKTVSGAHPMLGDGQKRERLHEEFAKELANLRATKPEDYMAIMRLCGFFETVGLMVEMGYVPLKEIDELLRGPIMATKHCFGLHIKERQNETGVPNGLYEHALNLSDMVERL